MDMKMKGLVKCHNIMLNICSILLSSSIGCMKLLGIGQSPTEE